MFADNKIILKICLMIRQDFLRENENKLANKLIQAKNNFDFFRFISACMVIVSHAFLLLKSNFKEPFALLTHNSLYLGGLGVNFFFLISGFLIAKSFQGSKSVFDYLKKRFLRIYPAYFVMIFLTLFVLGPLVTTFSLPKYFLSASFFKYFLNFVMYLGFPTLPGVFVNNTTEFGHIVNGSLWTLPLEVGCYLFVVVLGFLSIFKNRRLIFLFIFLGILSEIFVAQFNTICTSAGVHFFPCIKFVQLQGFRLCIFFLIGMMFYLYKDKIVLNKYIAMFSLFALFFIVNMNNFVLAYYSYFIFLPYLLMYSVFNFKFLNNFGKYGDFSYGIYIYAWPVEQLLILFFGQYLNPYKLALSTFFATLILAILSWHLIEKRCLKLKNLI